MGFFDKLKGKAIVNEKIHDNESIKDDLSLLTDIEVLKKIDSYAHELTSDSKKETLNKLTDAVKEFEKRFDAIPSEKKGEIFQSWNFLKIQYGNLTNPNMKMAYKANPSSQTIIVNEVSRYVFDIESKLSK